MLIHHRPPRVALKETSMGELLDFPIDRARASQLPDVTPNFLFDVTSPFSYLAAERVQRTLGDVTWVAVDGCTLTGRPHGRALARLRADAERRAEALRLPLIWPERFPAPAPGALRAASFACELGAGPEFALALGRLAFCGGFELDDPETIAEAAAAAGVPLGTCLQAAGESWRDDELREPAATAGTAGIRELPAFLVAGRWLEGEAGLVVAAALQAEREFSPDRSLAPAG
jgi:2-hydroxychromene-2-carboxylate isomerase